MQRIKGSRVCHIIVFVLAIMLIVTMMPLNTNEVYAASKPAKVKTVKLSSSTDTSLSLSWSKAKKAKQYQIAYKKVGTKKYSYAKTKVRNYTIYKLKASTSYNVKVRALNGKKKGKWSKTYKWKTKAKPSYSKAQNETTVKVSVTQDNVNISIGSLGSSGEAALYSTTADTYLTGDSLKGIVSKNVSGSKIGTFSMGSSKTFTIDRYSDSGYDRLYDKYYIVSGSKIIKGPIYATDVASSRNKVEMDTITKKGLVDELDEDSFTCMKDLGCQWTAINIDFTDLILANEKADGTPIDNSRKNAEAVDVNGKTIYIDRAYVSQLDARLSRYEKMGVNVVGIVISFVSTEGENNYPRALKYIDDARWTNGFNTSNELGRDYFIAGMEYLANRYSKGGKGLICDYVIGNEIDYTYDWYEILPNKSESGKALPPRGSNMGLRNGEIEVKAPLNTFMEEYNRTLRLANLAVKKYSSDISVGISISKEWATSRAERSGYATGSQDKRYNSYAPKEVLDWLNFYTKKEGDFDWTVTPHNYPNVSGNSAAYETGLSSDSKGKAIISGDPDKTQMITANNLEVMQLYLDRGYAKYNGNPREIYYTENGLSSGTEVGTPSATAQKEQAAESAQYYYRASCMPSVKAMIYYKITDRAEEGATSFKLGLKDTTGKKKLAYDVWKYIDTNRSFEVAGKYLGNISYKKGGKEYSKAKGNVSSYRDIMPIVESKYDWNSHWNEDAMMPVTVEEETVEAASLTVDKEVYDADDPILVTATGASTDLVGLYKKGETPADDPIYSYEVGGDQRDIQHKSGKEYDIRAYGEINTDRLEDAELPAGEYTVILSNDEEILVQEDITITGVSSFDSVKKVITNKQSYNVGEDIVVTASGEGKDWVGIYKKGETPSGTVNSFFWYYVADGSHISGKPSVIQAGTSNSRATRLPAGEYAVILLENDGYNIIARSEPITIESSSSDASNAIDSIEYKLDDETDGFANGTVTITKDAKSGSEACLMYWADENGTPLKGYTALAKFKLEDKVTKHEMQANTIIPPGAKTLIAYGLVGNTKSAEPVSVALPEGCSYQIDEDYDVCFPVISDLHVVDKGRYNDFNENTNYHVTNALEDVVKTMPQSIGVFVNGDMADHGRASEFKVLYNLFMGVDGAPDLHMVIGNHDWRTGNPDGQFQKYANLFNPAVEPEKVYYDEWVAGYHFIYMASESEGTIAYISDEQLEWLDQLLEEDSQKDQNRPIFLFLHEGLMDSMAGNYPGQWGYSNSVFQDGEIKSIVSKYGQVVMFGGHTHYDINTENTVTVGSEDFPVCVNTSAVGYLWDAYNTPAGEYLYGAQGQYLKVFDDKIYIFGRDFITGEYIPSGMYVVEPAKLDLKKSKINMSVDDGSINIGATTEDGMEITYRSSNPKVATVDYNGNVKAKSEGTALIYISTESSKTKAINRKIVKVTVTSAETVGANEVQVQEDEIQEFEVEEVEDDQETDAE